MKLASLHDGSRDGQLVVVSRDLGLACHASGIAGRLQQVLDDWNFLSPQLQSLYESLNAGRARQAFAFDPGQCLAPLPRPLAWCEGPPEPALATRLAAAQTPLPTEPVLVRMAGLAGPTAAPPPAEPGAALDFCPLLVAATGDVPAGALPEQALDGVRLLLLANGWRLHGPDVAALDRRPATACTPVAVTPDELGDAWRGGRLQASLVVQRGGKRFGLLPTQDAWSGFGPLLAALARRQPLVPGTLVAAGLAGTPESARGAASIAERRAHEHQADGAARSAWFAAGESLGIEVKTGDGQRVFGALQVTGAVHAPVPTDLDPADPTAGTD